jgi:hypothetical protein
VNRRWGGREVGYGFEGRVEERRRFEDEKFH